MNKENKHACYRAWRRSEAYMVPATEAGELKAQERYEGFCTGYEAGLKAAAFKMEQAHKENKSIHSFFLQAHNLIRELLR